MVWGFAHNAFFLPEVYRLFPSALKFTKKAIGRFILSTVIGAF